MQTRFQPEQARFWPSPHGNCGSEAPTTEWEGPNYGGRKTRLMVTNTHDQCKGWLLMAMTWCACCQTTGIIAILTMIKDASSMQWSTHAFCCDPAVLMGGPR
eukprot:2585836-Amphidinium_carterae.1